MQLHHPSGDIEGLNADNIDDIIDEGDDGYRDDDDDDDDWSLLLYCSWFLYFNFFLLWTSFVFYSYGCMKYEHDVSDIFDEFNVLNVWTLLLRYEKCSWYWESIRICIKCFI